MMPMTTASSVYMICNGSRVMPDSISNVLTNPRLPNSTIHPAARTALPTKSGRITTINSRFLKRDRVRARQYAIGKASTTQIAVHKAATRIVRRRIAT